MTAAARKEPAEFRAQAPLRGALYLLQQAGTSPTPDVLLQISQNVRSALDQLIAPDPERKHLEFVLLAVRESTVIDQYTHEGVTEYHARVVDPDLYHWAIRQIHLIGRQPAANGAAPPEGTLRPFTGD